MSKERLEELVSILSERGVRDIKFHLDRSQPTTKEQRVNDACEVLEAILEARYRPLPELGDSVR